MFLPLPLRIHHTIHSLKTNDVLKEHNVPSSSFFFYFVFFLNNRHTKDATLIKQNLTSNTP